MFKSKTYTIIYIIISLLAGLHLIVSPERPSLFVIRLLGLIWVLEGVVEMIHLVFKKNKE